MAFNAAYRAFFDPESENRDLSIEARLDLYALAWAYYRNTAFSKDNFQNWKLYLEKRGLYKHTRLIYNPVPRIVDFYVDNIWRPTNDSAFESLVAPVVPDTDETLKAAIAQLDQWGNFLSDALKIKRYAAALGNVLIEGVDDLNRQKVLHNAVWPGYVKEIELNDSGDVQGYTLEYDVFDPAERTTWRYRKIVTKESFSYFRDDSPFIPEGRKAAKEDNPYGFVFAVWIKHTDDGADFGLPACSGFEKIDEANSLASHLHDNIHKSIESPKIVSTADEVLPIVGASVDKETGQLVASDPRLNWVVFKTGAGAGVFDLAGSLHLAEANPYLTDLLASFADDYPELQAQSIIKQNTQLSGAALERLLTPAQNRLDGVQFGYNQQLIKFRQMGIAVGGFRRNGGGWSQFNEQTDVFRPFGLSSYLDGDLNFNLTKSLLIQTTDAESEDILTKKAARAVSLEGIVDQREQLNIAGYSDDQADEIMQRQAKENEVITDPNTIPSDFIRVD